MLGSTAERPVQTPGKRIASLWMMHCCGHILWSVLVELHSEFWNFVGFSMGHKEFNMKCELNAVI